MATNNLRFHHPPVSLLALTVIYFPIPVFIFLLCLPAGAHLNPAVTLSFCALEKVPWGKLVPYSLSQLLGAYLASGLVYLVYYGASVHRLKHFITYFKTNPNPKTSQPRIYSKKNRSTTMMYYLGCLIACRAPLTRKAEGL